MGDAGEGIPIHRYIFLMLSHITPFQVFLDAMSYELTIITIDAWANPEIVEDSRTGFVVEKSERIEYYTETFLPNWDTPQFLKAIQTPDLGWSTS